jgi:hypothetical protein
VAALRHTGCAVSLASKFGVRKIVISRIYAGEPIIITCVYSDYVAVDSVAFPGWPHGSGPRRPDTCGFMLSIKEYLTKDWQATRSALFLVFWLLDCGAHATFAAQGTIPDNRTIFNIPREPLGDALYAYSTATGIEVLADAALISGRTSVAIKGKYAAGAALHLLLARSGLGARYVDAGAFTLSELPAASPTGRQAELNPVDPYASYSAALQMALVHTLCRYDETRPGYYRALAQVWIGPNGNVGQAALLGTTGDDQLDFALVKLLRQVNVGEPPPRGMPQPATILVVPALPEQTGDCAAVEHASAGP